MLDYNFQLIYKKGNKMPADYLSCNVVSACPTGRWRISRIKTTDSG